MEPRKWQKGEVIACREGLHHELGTCPPQTLAGVLAPRIPFVLTGTTISYFNSATRGSKCSHIQLDIHRVQMLGCFWSSGCFWRQVLVLGSIQPGALKAHGRSPNSSSPSTFLVHAAKYFYWLFYVVFHVWDHFKTLFYNKKHCLCLKAN